MSFSKDIVEKTLQNYKFKFYDIKDCKDIGLV